MKGLHVCAMCGHDHHWPKPHGWVTVTMPGSWPPRTVKLCTACRGRWWEQGRPNIKPDERKP